MALDVEIEAIRDSTRPRANTVYKFRDGLQPSHPPSSDQCFRRVIETKNPDQRLIRKMVAIASALGASVQGDDGERYDRSGTPEPFPSLGFFERVKGFWSRVTARPLTPLDPSELPFKVGDRVRDVFGNEATVTVIDVRAEQGAGVITVKYDDGRTAQAMA